jgi:hypothetical protein
MNVRIKYPIEFTAGVYYQGELQMNNYVLKLSMLTNSLDGTTNNTALDRIKYFIYQEIDSSVFVNSENVDQCQLFIDAGVRLTTIPEEPIDQLVGIMLFHKLTAITEGRLIIDELELSSRLGEGIGYIHSDNENIDGLNMPDWWRSADLVHCDSDLIDTDDIVTVGNRAVWRDLDLDWPGEDTESGNTVVFADFKFLDETK